jgi:SSS family solute:Na+ symporter
MKAAADQDNARVLLRWEQVKASPATAQVVFRADEPWRKANGPLAAEMDGFNQSVQLRLKSGGARPAEEKLIGYKYDTAFGYLLSRLLPEGSGWQGFVLAALLGAVVSTLAAMLNAASTIFTMDLYRPYLAPEASQARLVRLGRIGVGVFMVLGCLVAPKLGDPRISNSIFAIIQESQAYIYSGILGVFVIGILVRRAPPLAGVVGLLIGPASFWLLKRVAPGMSFVNQASISFGVVIAAMLLVTWRRPLARPVELQRHGSIELSSSKSAKVFGVLVVLLTLALYLIFW